MEATDTWGNKLADTPTQITNRVITTSSNSDKSNNNTISKELRAYNSDITAYLRWIKSSHSLNDGIENMQPDCIIAITPARIGGLPWFARVLHWNKVTHQVQVR